MAVALLMIKVDLFSSCAEILTLDELLAKAE